MITYTDGACSGNPGPMGIGFVIFQDEKEIFRESKSIGNGTNNTAEYNAVFFALSKALELGAKSLIVRSDSLLIVKQLSGQYRIKEVHLRELKSKIESLIPKDFEIHFEHIPREENKIADKLSKDALK
ncbi:MAG: ribonuclease HI family protein [Candidatus Micrarchaeia archaeon]